MYDDSIRDWWDKGYVEEVPEAEQEQGFFLTHFPVVRRDKTSTKVRPVMNGAALSNGHCLNDFLLAGPKLINSLNIASDFALTTIENNSDALGGFKPPTTFQEVVIAPSATCVKPKFSAVAVA